MYAKVFSQIFDSSIADDFRLRHFFMDLLVLADVNGVVDMTATAISARTGIPLDDVTTMLCKLEAPDPESRTPDHDGRRIAKLDDHRSWGWCIINYENFRRIASEEQRREKTKLRVRKYRSKDQQNPPCNAPETHGNAPVTHGDAGNAMQRQRQMQKQIKEKVPAVAGAHQEFIQRWTEGFEAKFRVKYCFDAGRDGKAVKELLATGTMLNDLLAAAKFSWSLNPPTFETKQSLTIHGFRQYLNQLQVMFKNGRPQAHPFHPTKDLNAGRAPNSQAPYNF